MSSVLIIVIAVLITITVSYKMKINMGIVAFALAYIVGTFIFGMKVGDIIAMFPTKLFLILFSISLFFAFAVSNGTIKNLAYKATYKFRDKPTLIPIGIYIITAFTAGLGGGPYAACAIMAPITMAIVKVSGMDPLLAGITVITGSVGAANSPVGVSGLIFTYLVAKVGYVAQAGSFEMVNFLYMTGFNTLIFFIAYFILKGHKLKPIKLDEPPALTHSQKKSLYLVVNVILLYIIPQLLGLFIHDNLLLNMLQAKLDFTWMALIGGLIGLMLKLGDEKETIKAMPWNTIIIITGMGILIGVGTQAGAIKQLSAWMSSYATPTTTPIIMSCIAGFMAFFVSAIGVIMPTLFPLVPGIAHAAGASPILLFSIINAAAGAASFAPFAAGGALMFSFVEEGPGKIKYFNQMLVVPFIVIAINVALALLLNIVPHSF